ncbi:MAG: 16S rRNA (uracil(1498)-N(3))-methyltransferase [Eubacteriales bacterium]|nr:16S rRNA (uracil(1498)-N(3))-methyltransferase [Eubacteriales bacterium]
MYRFFVNQNQSNEVVLTGEQHHHISHVLRMAVEDELELVFADGTVYLARITGISREETVLTVRESIAGHELPIEVCLCQGLPKSDKMEMIIQKTVELGVTEILPLQMKNCVVRYDEKKQRSRQERWQKIAESAAKQSGRDRIPMVRGITTLERLVAAVEDFDLFLVPCEWAQSMAHTREVLNDIRSGMKLAIVIGPEGGFAPEEVRKLEAAGAKTISLGKRILRTETAGMYLLSVLGYLLEEE